VAYLQGWSRGTGPPRISLKKKILNSYIFADPDLCSLSWTWLFSHEQNIYMKYSLKLANERFRTLKNPSQRVHKLFLVLYICIYQVGPRLLTSYLFSDQRLASDIDNYCHNVIFLQFKRFSLATRSFGRTLKKKT